MRRSRSVALVMLLVLAVVGFARAARQDDDREYNYLLDEKLPECRKFTITEALWIMDELMRVSEGGLQELSGPGGPGPLQAFSKTVRLFRDRCGKIKLMEERDWVSASDICCAGCTDDHHGFCNGEYALQPNCNLLCISPTCPVCPDRSWFRVKTGTSGPTCTINGDKGVTPICDPHRDPGGCTGTLPNGPGCWQPMQCKITSATVWLRMRNECRIVVPRGDPSSLPTDCTKVCEDCVVPDSDCQMAPAFCTDCPPPMTAKCATVTAPCSNYMENPLLVLPECDQCVGCDECAPSCYGNAPNRPPTCPTPLDDRCTIEP